MLQMLFGLANHYYWHIYQIDVKSAFLNENLKNEIFMKILPKVEAEEG